jgi:hypothetical protein
MAVNTRVSGIERIKCDALVKNRCRCGDLGPRWKACGDETAQLQERREPELPRFI